MRLFGPTQGDIWKILSNDIDAEFEITDSFIKSYKVIKKFGDYTINLDTYSSGGQSSTTFTRIYSEFQNKHGFKFKIFGEYFKNYFPNFFDMQDIHFEDLKSFIIRSNNEFAIKALLENPAILDLIKMQPEMLFKIHNRSGEKVTPNSFNTICIELPGVIKDNEILKNSFELIGESLLEIEKLNNEYESLDVNNFSHFDVVKNSIKNVIIDNFEYDKIKDNISNSIHKLIKPSHSSDSNNENTLNYSEIVKETSSKKNEIKCPIECENTDTDKNNSSIDDSQNIQIQNSTKTNTINHNDTDLSNLTVDMSNLKIDTSNLTINTDNLKVDMSNLEKKLNDNFEHSNK